MVNFVNTCLSTSSIWDNIGAVFSCARFTSEPCINSCCRWISWVGPTLRVLMQTLCWRWFSHNVVRLRNRTWHYYDINWFMDLTLSLSLHRSFLLQNSSKCKFMSREIAQTILTVVWRVWALSTIHHPFGGIFLSVLTGVSVNDDPWSWANWICLWLDCCRRYYFSLFLEFSDITMPLVRAVVAKVSSAVSFFLVCLIGRSLGLIYTGIRQALGWRKWETYLFLFLFFCLIHWP